MRDDQGTFANGSRSFFLAPSEVVGTVQPAAVVALAGGEVPLAVRATSLSGAPYGGACLPKDTEAFMSFCEDMGLEHKMLAATIAVNEDLLTTRPAAIAHVCRTICRRAERSMVRLHNAEPLSDAARRFINRLSDLLFILGRLLNRAGGRGDVLWQKGKNAA